MEKKHIVISGGMGGIGRAIAQRLAADGHMLYLLYHVTPPAEAETFVATLPSPEVHRALHCDITDPAAVTTALASFERIDVCIHAAVSPLVRRRISLIEPEDFRQQFEVTAFGGFNLFKAVVPLMKKSGGGSLIGLTTTALLPAQTPTTMAGYICAKHALRGILREFYADVAGNNIRVNAVAPAFIDTPLHKDLPERSLELLRAQKPATAEDVAAILSYLTSAEGDTVTGRTFVVGKTKSECDL